MRYLDLKFLILAATILFSVVIGIKVYSPKTPSENAALAINDRIITVDELKELFNSRSFYTDTHKEFINALITKEILIQEAMHEGIDREEAFRLSVQYFFEHALIKTLLDRKYSSLSPDCSEELVDRYVFLSSRRVHLTRFSYKPGKPGTENELIKTEKIISPFEELTMDIRCQILQLKAGETIKGETDPILELVTEIQFDSSEEIRGTDAPDKEHIRKIVTDCAKEQSLAKWISDLKNNANIKIWDAAYGESGHGK